MLPKHEKGRSPGFCLRAASSSSWVQAGHSHGEGRSLRCAGEAGRRSHYRTSRKRAGSPESREEKTMAAPAGPAVERGLGAGSSGAGGAQVQGQSSGWVAAPRPAQTPPDLFLTFPSSNASGMYLSRACQPKYTNRPGRDLKRGAACQKCQPEDEDMTVGRRGANCGKGTPTLLGAPLTRRPPALHVASYTASPREAEFLSLNAKLPGV